MAQNVSPAPGAALPGEFIYAAASKDVWDHVRTLMRELRFRSDEDNQRRQVFVTQWETFSDKGLPDAAALGVSEGYTPIRVQFHLAGAPQFEPARIAIGVIIELEKSSDRSRARIHRHERVERWLANRLGERLAVKWLPLSADAGERAEQSKRLMPPGVTSACATQPASILTEEMRDKVTAPRVRFKVQPMYPGGLKRPESGRVVKVDAKLTEHGTLTETRLLEPVPTEEMSYARSALGAVSLWRYEPAVARSCPILVMMTVTVNYVW
jgi:hypothetical protein